MKVALVHDYLKEYGGAERVLMALHEIWPQAPLYTAFRLPSSTAGRAFAKARVIESVFAPLIKYKNLYSPLRFLAPLIWQSFDLREYDLVITSASWYITRGFRVSSRTKVICYCHTPPRYLYGYPTSVEWQRYWPVKLYGLLLAHFLRLYDFQTAQKVNYFLANSNNVQVRIKKFYRREAKVIYPPVAVAEISQATLKTKPEDWFLLVSRVVGGKGIEMAIQAARKAKVKIKIVGEPAGLHWFGGKLAKLKNNGVEFLGRVKDEKLFQLYGQCRALLATAQDEDFGITPVEAQAAGRPVIAYHGGGYLETIVAGKTGEFFNDYKSDALAKALKNFRSEEYSPAACRKQAAKFGQARFKKEIKEFVKKHA